MGYICKIFEKHSSVAQWDICSFLLNSIAHNNIGSKGASSIADALRVNTSLVKLNLGKKLNKVVEDNKIEAAGIAEIAAALKENSTISHFNVAKNQLGNNGAVAIAKVLEVNKTLDTLNLGILEALSIADNAIADDGAVSLTKSLEKNSTLRILNLGNSPHYK